MVFECNVFIETFFVADDSYHAGHGVGVECTFNNDIANQHHVILGTPNNIQWGARSFPCFNDFAFAHGLSSFGVVGRCTTQMLAHLSKRNYSLRPTAIGLKNNGHIETIVIQQNTVYDFGKVILELTLITQAAFDRYFAIHPPLKTNNYVLCLLNLTIERFGFWYHKVNCGPNWSTSLTARCNDLLEKALLYDRQRNVVITFTRPDYMQQGPAGTVGGRVGEVRLRGGDASDDESQNPPNNHQPRNRERDRNNGNGNGDDDTADDNNNDGNVDGRNGPPRKRTKTTRTQANNSAQECDSCDVEDDSDHVVKDPPPMQRETSTASTVTDDENGDDGENEDSVGGCDTVGVGIGVDVEFNDSVGGRDRDYIQPTVQLERTHSTTFAAGLLLNQDRDQDNNNDSNVNDDDNNSHNYYQYNYSEGLYLNNYPPIPEYSPQEQQQQQQKHIFCAACSW
eukprot:CAMPEP_0170862324 /NCGR_PEP_ID=MMETSP0734-20130129/18892_1 /TAXON_ID=186038 /ORGANISM="Fragilariopsis kerguelensis, Strain L26-C5" /LENGTH=452 /DNA_ID=CAMNT_0011236875 /DNA_START=316 /DNA_END=1671 /DNA_ORIENTATION=+